MNESEDAWYKQRAISKDGRILLNILLYWINRQEYNTSPRYKQCVLETMMSMLIFSHRKIRGKKLQVLVQKAERVSDPTEVLIEFVQSMGKELLYEYLCNQKVISYEKATFETDVSTLWASIIADCDKGDMDPEELLRRMEISKSCHIPKVSPLSPTQIFQLGQK
jgi:hypothetical protein